MSEETKVYRILVVEDTLEHQESAKKTLAGHEVTIVSTFREAMNQSGEFDVVLTDMTFPIELGGAYNPRLATGGEGIIAHYGFVIALMAALRGAKYIAMITDTSHHAGAMSAALDFIGTHGYYRESFSPNFVINGARVMFVHAPLLEEVVGKQDCWSCYGSGICKFCSGTGVRSGNHLETFDCNVCGDTTHVGKCKICSGAKLINKVEYRKDWRKVLRDLTADEQTQNQGDEEV